VSAKKRGVPTREWLASLNKWVSQCFQTQPLWRVRTPQRHWFCPYCGRAAFKAAPDGDLVRLISNHLAQQCEPFEEIGAVSIFNYAGLQARALPLRIKGWLGSTPAWRVRDHRERWVCPYCIRTTEASLAGGRVSREVLDQIIAHVTSCSAYKPETATRFHALEDIHDAVAERGTQEKLLDQINQLVRTQPVWQVILNNQNWVCPYCRRAIHDVAIRSTFELQNNAPSLICSHLTEVCRGYAEAHPAATSAERLLEAAHGRQVGQTSRIERERVTGQELGRASQVFNSVREELSEQASEMDLELAEARSKQLSMLPSLPVIPGLEFYVHYEPSHILAGDFYDFIELTNDRLGIAVGDVTGHGVNAALVMGMCKKVLNLMARMHDSPTKAVQRANDEIIKDLDGRTFVSLLYGELDPNSATLRFVRAGHEPLLVYNSERYPELQVLKPKGMAVGLTKGARFADTLKEATLTLQPGDLCCLYTDGLTEAQDPGGEEFGTARLHDLIASNGEAGAEELVQLILRQLRLFADGKPLDDDLTILTLRYG